MIRYVCKCGAITSERRCPDCKHVPFEGSTRRKRLPSNWERLRKQVLTVEPICAICGEAESTEVDHIQPGDDHRLVNLQGLCRSCHRTKTAKEGNAARGSTKLSPIAPTNGKGIRSVSIQRGSA